MIRSGRLWQVLYLSFILCHMAAGPVHAQADGIEHKLEERRKDLQEIKRKIATEAKRFREDARRERQIAADLAEVKRQLERKKQEAAKLQRDIDRRRMRVVQLNQEIKVSEGRLAKARYLLAIRLRAIYKQGKMGVTSLFLSAGSLQEAALNIRYLQAVARHDRQLIQNFKLAILAHKGKKEEVGRELADLGATQKALKVKQGEIAQDERQKRALLAEVRSDKADRLQRLSELKRSQAALQDLIGQLQKKMEALRAASPKGQEVVYLKGLHFAAAKGKLSWPTPGQILSAFGRQEHPRYHTFTFNKGIDIGAPVGQEIKAVFEGIILFADWFRGYGKMAIIDHGQGFYSLYAHASELLVNVGDKVALRQVIGRVGDSGSPEGTRLHFEIRQNGKPENPIQWLVPNP
jgi:septal ring factor EnvC (AmiA/AmiB activator)